MGFQEKGPKKVSEPLSYFSINTSLTLREMVANDQPQHIWSQGQRIVVPFELKG